MNLWRLEWLRLTRTRRWIALLVVNLLFAVIGPFTARYAGELVERFGGGIDVTFPEPVPPDGMIQYIDGALQLGLLTAVIVAARALAFDSKPTIGVFFRTRVTEMSRILLPRYVVSTVAAIVAFILGALLAWYETVLLLGSPDAAATTAGVAFASLYLALAVALVAAFAGLFRTGLGAVLGSLGTLLLLPIAGILPVLEEWLPSHLVGATTSMHLEDAAASDYLRATAVTVAFTAAALWLAVAAARRREL